MPANGNGNGRGNRLSFLNAASLLDYPEKPIDLTPDEARALIDQVFRNYGLDPTKATDSGGWRHLSLGSANGAVGVVEWQADVYYLVVFAPILDLPIDPVPPLAELYRLLLELNHGGTLATRFSIDENVIYVSLTRPIHGLDQEEVDDAIRTVMTVADSYDEWLRAVLDTALGAIPPPLPELPNIRMTPKEAQAIGTILVACDSHGQSVFRYLMEQWQKAGYFVDPATTGIGFKILLGTKLYSLASIRPGVGERRQLIILSWEGLRKQKAFSSKAVDEFQSAVTKITAVKVTESMGHIEVSDSFTLDSAKTLLRAMQALAQEAHPELAGEEIFVWDPTLPKPNIVVGPATLAGLHETLRTCKPRVQQMYLALIEGWGQAGGTVQCSRPGRIYLKLQTGEHEFGQYGRVKHKFNLAVLAAPKGDHSSSIDVAWNLATGDYPYLNHVPDAVARFEATVANLPGFGQQGVVTRLTLDRTFQMEHAQALLEAMLALKAAEEKVRG